MDDRFESNIYTIRRKVFKIFGAAFHILDADERIVAYSSQKAFKLREDIRLYTGEDMREELLVISARSIIDFAAAYDVHDSRTGDRVGALKRKGFGSIFRDKWIFMDENDREIGTIQEDHAALAFVRRFLTNLIPQTFRAEMHGEPVCIYRQRFNPFIQKIDVDFSVGPDEFDKRLGLAAGVLLSAVEGRQE